MSARERFRDSLILTGFFLTSTLCQAIADEPQKTTPPRNARAAVEAILARPADVPGRRFQFTNVPFGDVVLDLKQKHGLEIELDTKALESAGISTKTPITKRSHGIPLGLALRRLLENLDLTFVIRNDVLLITTPKGAIEQELSTTTEFEYVETPLTDVIADLENKHGIEIELDTKALEDAGVSSDIPITKNLKGITLRSALRLLLGGLDLTFVIKDDVLLITTPEAANSMVELRVYDVERLLGADHDTDKLAKAAFDALQVPKDSMRVVAYKHLIIVNGAIPLHERMNDLLAMLEKSLGRLSARQQSAAGNEGAVQAAPRVAASPASDPFADTSATAAAAKAEALERDPFGSEPDASGAATAAEEEAAIVDPFGE